MAGKKPKPPLFGGRTAKGKVPKAKKTSMGIAKPVFSKKK